MRELLWIILARILAVPCIARYIIERAERTPYKHIHGLNGERYMGRWWLVQRGTRAARWLERLTGFTCIRVHNIRQQDHDRDLHSHPFAYRTIILRGAYCEEYAWRETPDNRRSRLFTAGQTNATGDGAIHRISHVYSSGRPYTYAWTLFFMGEKQPAWGFYTDHGYVDSDTYLARAGYVDKGKHNG